MHSFNLAAATALTLASMAVVSASSAEYLDAAQCPNAPSLNGRSRYLQPAPNTEIPVDGNITLTFCTSHYFKETLQSYDLYIREISDTLSSDLIKVSEDNTNATTTSVMPFRYYDSPTKGWNLTRDHELVLAERWNPYQSAQALTFTNIPIKLVAATGSSSSDAKESRSLTIARDH